jgi:hypothetical protein
MIEVDPLDLIPGEKYYLEQKSLKSYRQDLGFSTSAIGTFIKYSQTHHGIFAEFKNIKSVNKKPTDFLNPHSDLFTFHVAPYGSGFKIYKATRDSILDRKDKEAQLFAFEKMINKQKLPEKQDNISIRSMFAEKPEDFDSTFYGSNDNKSSVGTQLMREYGSKFLNKKKAGKRPCKTCKRYRNSKKTKSRRR